MNVLAVIPAREGSRGIPQKNLRLLGGKPLLRYTIEAARAARRLARVIVSTESPAVAEIARQQGGEVPFLRPASLATDEAPMLPVVQHALAWCRQQGQLFEAVCLLQPTHPFRAAGEIDACIARLEEGGYDAVATFQPVPQAYHPAWVFSAGADGMMRLSSGAPEPVARRQALPPVFHRDGSVYVTRREVVEQGSLYGRRLGSYVPARPVSINLDTLEDWQRAERWLEAQAVAPAGAKGAS